MLVDLIGSMFQLRLALELLVGVFGQVVGRLIAGLLLATASVLVNAVLRAALVR